MFLLFRRLYRAARFITKTRNLRLLLLLSNYKGLKCSDFEVLPCEKIYLKGTKIDLVPPSRHFLLEGYLLYSDLVKSGKAEFLIDQDGELIMHFGSISLFLRSWQELFIAHEIFYQGCYNILIQEPFYFLDIGFNVGIASIFFGAKSNCLAIQAFEPFPATYQRGCQNLNLNSWLKNKVQLHNYGLSFSDNAFRVEYCEELKGSIGVFGISPFAKNSTAPNRAPSVVIYVKEAAKEVRLFLQNKPHAKVVCKIDCEGSEYEILPRLASEGILDSIDIFMIEWHEKGPESLEVLLEKNGFCILSLAPYANNHGMIYAWK